VYVGQREHDLRTSNWRGQNRLSYVVPTDQCDWNENVPNVEAATLKSPPRELTLGVNRECSRNQRVTDRVDYSGGIRHESDRADE